MRASSEKHRATIKAACRLAVDMAGGGKALASRSRVNPPALSKYGSQSEPDSFMPLDVAYEADLEAGTPVIATALAELLGFRLVAIEVPLATSIPTLEQAFAVLKETVEVFQTYQDGISDGRLDMADRQALRLQVNQAIRALQDFGSRL